MGDWALRLRRCSQARSDKVVLASNSRAPGAGVKSKLDRNFTVLANAPVGSLHRRYRRGQSLSPLAITSDIVQECLRRGREVREFTSSEEKFGKVQIFEYVTRVREGLYANK